MMIEATQEDECGGYDPEAPEVCADPYPAYARLRRAGGPVYLPRRQWWLISRYFDVRAALSQPEIFSSRPMRPSEPALLGADPPGHTATRVLVEEAMRRAPVTSEWLRDTARALVLRMRSAGRCDFMAMFARELPARVVTRILGLGEVHIADLQRWATAWIRWVDGERSESGAPSRDAAEMSEFFAELVDRRMREPTEDVLGILARSGLPRAHLHSVAMLLLTGGNETTAHLLGNAFLTVSTTPALRSQANGGEMECARILEESLRHDSPVQMLMRTVTRDVEIGGSLLPAGAVVALLVGSANRDESVFQDADRFVPSRGGRPHLAFGLGPHLCVGARLSRREAMIGLAEVCRGADIRLANDAARIDRIRSFRFRGPASLWVDVN
jgi:cytochrome P450